MTVPYYMEIVDNNGSLDPSTYLLLFFFFFLLLLLLFSFSFRVNSFTKVIDLSNPHENGGAPRNLCICFSRAKAAIIGCFQPETYEPRKKTSDTFHCTHWSIGIPIIEWLLVSPYNWVVKLPIYPKQPVSFHCSYQIIVKWDFLCPRDS